MIRHTFSVLDGVGEKREKRLWAEGIVSWEDFLVAERVPFFSEKRTEIIRESICYFKQELVSGNPEPFADFIRQREHWRLFDAFRDGVLCLDIETNGLPPGRGGAVTLVGLYDERGYRCLVRGEDLTEERLTEEISGDKILVTFFGSSFDLPFLRNEFPSVRFRIPHFDLCFGARRLGMKGGLKKIERQFGLFRAEEVTGLDGYDAVLLWKKWLRGDRKALDLVIKYNREDTVNLLHLSERIYKLLRDSTGIGRYLELQHY